MNLGVGRNCCYARQSVAVCNLAIARIPAVGRPQLKKAQLMPMNAADEHQETGDRSAGDESADSRRGARPRIIDSQELLSGRREVWIEHGEDMYRLRLTASGKLYLTK